ncbi:MAG: N-acetylmuramoyl-L-alanine amidase [Planctomycetes bacterium]|nr:N-acetylmuramoyl-L-alanine amidase [Planctomycetota bacterium]
MRPLLAALASLACLAAAAGCQQKQACLVRAPPPPYFGPRVATALPMPSRSSPARPATLELPRDPSRSASWGTAAWRPSDLERPWRFIVIHHSATAAGSAAQFDRMHRDRGWDELGYHFVIGNGTGSYDGEVEVGSRWPKQKHGAHCKVADHPEYNDYGIGICLVGNFDLAHPSEAQMQALARLVRFLMDRYGIPRGRIYGHGQLKATDCPGRNFDYGDLFRRL